MVMEMKDVEMKDVETMDMVMEMDTEEVMAETNNFPSLKR
jgi:hypothetical protein